jgi:hypothetical protein
MLVKKILGSLQTWKIDVSDQFLSHFNNLFKMRPLFSAKHQLVVVVIRHFSHIQRHPRYEGLIVSRRG